MPTDPRTWAAADYFTANYADGDLYQWNGQPFVPTGIQFHARRPVYKSFAPNGGASTAAGAWADPFFNGTLNLSNVLGDTGGLFGAYTDPYASGHIRSAVLAGAGVASAAGGLGLVFGQVHWNNMSAADNIAAALGDYTVNPPGASNRGAPQQANINRETQAYVVDIVQLNSVRWGLFGLNGGSIAHSTLAPDNSEGSGRATRFGSFWASAFPANGHTAGTLPAPVSSWSSGSTVTASLLNGNTGIRDVLRFLNMPPLLRAEGAGGQSLTSGVANTVTLGTTTYDTYSGYNSGTSTYTVARAGLYLVYGTATCNNFSGSLRVGVTINGSTYWGPYSPMPTSGNGGGSKMQVFSLNAGDTVQLTAWPTAAATTATGFTPRLVMLWLGKSGTPSPLPIVPDTSFRWLAGTPGDLSTLFNAHIANDLNFLVQRPYLMAYQTVAQTGIAQATSTKVTMDTVAGIIHADTGDNYSGWSSVNKNYVCPRSGWYLAVEEVFLAQPTQTTSPVVAAMIGNSPTSVAGWDFGQIQNMPTTAIQFPGAGHISLYYMRAGDTITPGVWTQDSSATTIATAVAATINSHFELVWMGE